MRDFTLYPPGFQDFLQKWRCCGVFYLFGEKNFVGSKCQNKVSWITTLLTMSRIHEILSTNNQYSYVLSEISYCALQA